MMIYTISDFYLLIVLAFLMSTTKQITTHIHSMVDFQLLNGT